MKGSIEIYNNDGLVYKNDNLLVDGAGEAFADLLTISPSLSGIVSASALLDTSNYTIQAISFGKGRTGFLNNSHAFDSSATNTSVDTKETFYAVCGISTGDNNAVAVVFTGDRDVGSQTSSLSVVAGLPDFPTPMDTTLERDVQISGGAFTDPDSTLYNSGYNDTMKSMGQNPNYLPYINEVGFATSNEGLASYVGCYPAGSGTGGTEWYLASDSSDMHSSYTASTAYFDQSAKDAGRVVSGTYNSYVNEASSMDSRGFIGKVYDVKQVVGVVPSPNLLAWTYEGNMGDSPGITFNSDLNGTFWGSDNIGTFSGIAETNPLGGPSSIQLSGTLDNSLPYCGWWPRDGNSKWLGFQAGTTQVLSMYWKRPGDASVAPSSFMMKFKDITDSNKNYTSFFEYLSDGLVPTVKSQSPYHTTLIENAGDDWYRIQIRQDGLGTSETVENDSIRCYFYLGDSDGAAASVQGKYLLAYGPQFEQHPLAYNLSAQPYQQVSGSNPTIAEQNGIGGLHVSGGLDATNLGTVEYSITVGSGDCGMAHLYGGIYTMGLWTIDNTETSGITAPYTFHPYESPQIQYKLFSKHSLSRDLTYINDDGTDAGLNSFSDLRIVWKLDFYD